MDNKNLLLILTLLLLGILTWQLRWALMILFGAIVIAVALDVLIQRLQKIVPLPRPLALSFVVSSLILIGFFVFKLLVPELIIQIDELGSLFPTLINKFNSLITTDERFSNLSIAEKFNWGDIQPFGAKLLDFAGGAANSVLQLILISLLALLIALDPSPHRRIVISATPLRARKGMDELLDDFRLALGGWLTGMTISALSIFVLTWIGLSLLNAPLALLSSLVCGLLTFIPTIGPTAATLLPLGVAILSSPTLMFQVLILRVVLQNFEAFILTPLLLRRTVNLLPTVALMSQLSLGILLGLPGVLIALPLAVVLQVSAQKILVTQIMNEWR